MKALTFFLILTGTVLVDANTIQRKEDEALIDQLFDLLRMTIKSGYPEYGIPVMDPYQLIFANIESTGDFISVKANITNGTFSGLGGFEILQFDFIKEEFALQCDVSFPSLKFSAEYYEMEGSIRDVFPLAGRGVLHVEVYDFNLRSKIVFKQSENKKSIVIDKFEGPQFQISRIVSKTDFDKNIDSIANAMIEELLPGYLNRFNKFLAEAYSEPIVNSLNKLLIKLESWRMYMLTTTNKI